MGLSGRNCAQEESDGCPRRGFKVLALLQALTNNERMREGDDRPHDQVGRLARINRLELTTRDAVAQ